MHSAVPMRIAKIGHLVLAAFLLVLGVLLVADPSLQVGWKYACGVFLILLGAVKITGFLSKDLYRLAFQYDSIYGVLLIGIGLIFLVRPVLTVESTGLLLGIFVFTDGIIKIQVARHASSAAVVLWIRPVSGSSASRPLGVMKKVSRQPMSLAFWFIMSAKEEAVCCRFCAGSVSF